MFSLLRRGGTEFALFECPDTRVCRGCSVDRRRLGVNDGTMERDQQHDCRSHDPGICRPSLARSLVEQNCHSGKLTAAAPLLKPAF